MKFLVINRPSGADHGLSRDPANLRHHAAELKKLIASQEIQGAWVLQEGGHAYILNAYDSEELAIKLRWNPLYEASDTQVIPVMDAVDFLEGYATYAESH
jgi:hypothetical protein